MRVQGPAYAHPGGDLLFSDVSFRVSPGQHAGLVGRNGVGRRTLLKILAGILTPGDGSISLDGIAGYMAQDVGVGDRYLMVLHDGRVLSLPACEVALEAIVDPGGAADVRLAKPL